MTELFTDDENGPSQLIAETQDVFGRVAVPGTQEGDKMDRRVLTVREAAVAELVAKGMTNAEIAAVLNVSLATAKRHLNNIMIKWNCANRTQVAVEAIRRASRLSPDNPRLSDADRLKLVRSDQPDVAGDVGA